MVDIQRNSCPAQQSGRPSHRAWETGIQEERRLRGEKARGRFWALEAILLNSCVEEVAKSGSTGRGEVCRGRTVHSEAGASLEHSLDLTGLTKVKLGVKWGHRAQPQMSGVSSTQEPSSFAGGQDPVL